MGIESSGFFNSEYDEQNDKWDREYSAEQIAEYFAKLVSNGVFEGGLQVKQSSNETPTMNVKVSAGNAMINGYWYTLSEEKFFEVNVNATLNSRVDCICLQYNFNNREIKSVYHEGVSTPTRNNEMYELMLCTISVGPSATAITQSSITDKRYDSAACGIVTGLIDQINFDEAYSQFSAWFNEFRGRMETNAASFVDRLDGIIVANQSKFDTWMNQEKTAFDNWFEHLQVVMGENVATKLQSEIDTLQSDLSALETNVQGDVSALQTGKENKRTIVAATIATNQWSSGTYSFEGAYPNATYDIEQIQPYGTADQLKAWGKAMVVGNPNGNTITCRGAVPTVNIPIMFYVKRK